MSRGPVPDRPTDRPTVDQLIPRLREYYKQPGNGVGGSLHIVLDDGNLHDSHLAYCVERAEQKGDTEGAELGRLMLEMTSTQRRRLASMNFYPW